jgi:hypothetical protein
MHGAGRGCAEGSDPVLLPARGGQQQVSGDSLRRGARGAQHLGGRRVPRLPFARRKILIQRGPRDRMHEPQALGRSKQASPDEGVGRLASRVRGQPAIRAASGNRAHFDVARAESLL